MSGAGTTPLSAGGSHVLAVASRDASMPVYNLLSWDVSKSTPGHAGISDAEQFLPRKSFASMFDLPSRGIPTPPSPGYALLLKLDVPLSRGFYASRILFSAQLPHSVAVKQGPTSTDVCTRGGPTNPTPTVANHLSDNV